MSEPSNAPSVPLPHRHRRDSSSKSQRAPIWPLESARSGLQVPLAARCSRATRQGGVCCKDLKHDERTLVDPDIVRDIVIGLSDGLTVPFALTAGLSSLGESKFVVLAGVAELFAGAISMGIGGFLASQSERDHYRYLRQQTAARVLRSCDGEMEREVADVLGPLGVDDQACSVVAKSLRHAEMTEADDGHGEMPGARVIDEETIGLRWSKEVGLTAFLLRFGQGLEEVPDKRMYISAFTIGMGYFLGGLIPLLPYFFIPQAQVALIYSVIVTGVILLVFGAVKAHITGAGVGTYSYVWGAVSTLLVGGIAAGASFGIVKALEG